MATYSELAEKRVSEKVVAAVIRFLQVKKSSDFVSYSTYYKIAISNKVEAVYTTTLLTMGTDKDSLTSGQWFYDNGYLYVNTSPANIYIRQKLFYATSYIELKENITSGDMVVFEPRLRPIPDFSQKIDPLNNSSYTQSKINLEILNQDSALDDIIRTSFFRNQSIDIYSIIEPSLITDSEIRKLATVATEEISESDKKIQLKTKDTDVVLKSNVLEVQEKSQFLLGYLDSYKPVSIEVEDTTDYLPTGYTVYFTPGNSSTDSKFSFSDLTLLQNVFIGSRIKLMGGNIDQTVWAFPIEQPIKSIASNNDMLFNWSFEPSSFAGNCDLYIHKDDYSNYLKSFKLTKNNISGTDKTIKTKMASSAAINDNFIILTDNWDFLKDGDLLTVKEIYTESSIDYVYPRQYKVKEYDPTLKKVTFYEKIPFAMSNTTDYTVFYNKVLSVDIDNLISNDELYTYKLRFNGAASGLPYTGGEYYGLASSTGLKYYLWFDDGTISDPAPAGYTAGFRIPFTTSMTKDQLRAATVEALMTNTVVSRHTFVSKFSAFVSEEFSDGVTIKVNEHLQTYYYEPFRYPVPPLLWGWDYPKAYKKKFYDYNLSGSDVTITIDPIAMTLWGKIGLHSSDTLHLNGGSANRDKRRIQLPSGKIDEYNIEPGDVIVLQTFTTTSFNTPYVVNEIDPVAHHIYVDKEFASSSTYSANWSHYKKADAGESAKVFVTTQLNNPNIGATLENILVDMFEVSNYDITSIAALKDTKYLNIGLVVKENQQLYKIINEIIKGTNIVYFTNRSGDLEFKNIDIDNLTSLKSFNEEDLISYSRKVEDKINRSVTVNYDKEYKTNTQDKIVLTDPDIDNISDLLDIKNEKVLATNLVFSSSITENEDQIKNKYFRNIEEIEVIGTLELSDFELGDCISFTNLSGVSPSQPYIIIEIRTNGFQSKIKVQGFLNPITA